MILLSKTEFLCTLYVSCIEFRFDGGQLFVAVPGGTLPTDEREHEPESPLVGNCADGYPPQHRLLADATLEKFLRGKEARLDYRPDNKWLTQWLSCHMPTYIRVTTSVIHARTLAVSLCMAGYLCLTRKHFIWHKFMCNTISQKCVISSMFVVVYHAVRQ